MLAGQLSFPVDWAAGHKRAARAEYNKQYRASNNDKLRAYHRQYYADNRARKLEYAKQFAVVNSEKLKQRRRKFYAANAEKLREDARRRRAADPQKYREINRTWGIRNFKKRILGSVRSRAKSRGIEFSITVSDLEWTICCPVLGIKLDYIGRGLKPNTATIDRIDNTKGYILGNVRIISNRANSAKKDLTADELRRLADYAAGLI